MTRHWFSLDVKTYNDFGQRPRKRWNSQKSVIFIQFIYHPVTFYVGAVFSLCTVLLLVVFYLLNTFGNMGFKRLLTGSINK